MGYPIDLDEFTMDVLKNEVSRRYNSLKSGICGYCKQSIEKHQCKYEGTENIYHGTDAIDSFMIGKRKTNPCSKCNGRGYYSWGDDIYGGIYDCEQCDHTGVILKDLTKKEQQLIDKRGKFWRSKI